MVEDRNATCREAGSDSYGMGSWSYLRVSRTGAGAVAEAGWTADTVLANRSFCLHETKNKSVVGGQREETGGYFIPFLQCGVCI